MSENQLEMLLDSLPVSTLNLLRAKLGASVPSTSYVQRPSPAQKTLREQYQLLYEYYWEMHLDWIQFLRGFITTQFTERGNISVVEDRKDPYARWLSGPNASASTALCLAPRLDDKRVRKPEKAAKAGKSSEGYVYFQMPTWLKESVAAVDKPVAFEKISLHRLALIADMVLNHVDSSSIRDSVESSHFCGNEWCTLHLGWETKSVNQDRGPCFDPTRANLPCSGHNSNPLVFCVRSREASSRVPRLLNGEGQDTRSICEIPTVRRWWNERDSESGRRAKTFYEDLLKSGGKGMTGAEKVRGGGGSIIAKWFSSPLKGILKKK